MGVFVHLMQGLAARTDASRSVMIDATYFAAHRMVFSL